MTGAGLIDPEHARSFVPAFARVCPTCAMCALQRERRDPSCALEHHLSAQWEPLASVRPATILVWRVTLGALHRFGNVDRVVFSQIRPHTENGEPGNDGDSKHHERCR